MSKPSLQPIRDRGGELVGYGVGKRPDKPDETFMFRGPNAEYEDNGSAQQDALDLRDSLLQHRSERIATIAKRTAIGGLAIVLAGASLTALDKPDVSAVLQFSSGSNNEKPASPRPQSAPHAAKASAHPASPHASPSETVASTDTKTLAYLEKQLQQARTQGLNEKVRVLRLQSQVKQLKAKLQIKPQTVTVTLPPKVIEKEVPGPVQIKTDVECLWPLDKQDETGNDIALRLKCDPAKLTIINGKGGQPFSFGEALQFGLATMGLTMPGELSSPSATPSASPVPSPSVNPSPEATPSVTPSPEAIPSTASSSPEAQPTFSTEQTFFYANFQGAGHRGNVRERTKAMVELIHDSGANLVAGTEVEPKRGNQLDIVRQELGSDWKVVNAGPKSRSVVAYKTSDYEEAAPVEPLPIDYFDGHDVQVPIVFLRHRETGAVIAVISYHNPSSYVLGYGNQLKWRLKSRHTESLAVQGLEAAGIDNIVAVGDDNPAPHEETLPELLAKYNHMQYPAAQLKPKNPPNDQFAASDAMKISGYEAIDNKDVSIATDHRATYRFTYKLLVRPQ